MSMYQKGSPYPVEVQAGQSVWICRCGLTGKPPFCDGSHAKSDGKTPLEHKATQAGKIYVCGCGRSGNIPFCDGSHNR